MAEQLIRPPQPGPGGKTVWVSNAPATTPGDGSGPTKVLRTVAAGRAQMRPGKPDVLAFERGTTYDESFGSWKTSGPSTLARQIICHWGNASKPRPIVRAGQQSGLVFDAPAAHVTISGLVFKGSMGPWTSGILVLGADVDDLVIERCDVSGFITGICPTGGGRRSNWKLRETVVADCYHPTNDYDGNGSFWDNIHGYEIDRCLFLRNGVRPDGKRTACHGAYNIAKTTSGLVSRDNIFALNGNTGLSARAGGVAEDCLFVANGIGLSYGASDNPLPGGVKFTGRRLVFTESADIGWAAWVRNVNQGLLEDVIMANAGPGTQGRSYLIGGNNQQTDPIKNLTTRRMVIHNHGQGPQIDEPVGKIGNVTFQDCEGPAISGAAQHGAQIKQTGRKFGDPVPAYTDPGRSVASYDKEVLGGPGTLAHFFQEARKGWGQPQYSAKAVNRWIAAGFGKAWA